VKRGEGDSKFRREKGACQKKLEGGKRGYKRRPFILEEDISSRQRKVLHLWRKKKSKDKRKKKRENFQKPPGARRKQKNTFIVSTEKEREKKKRGSWYNAEKRRGGTCARK